MKPFNTLFLVAATGATLLANNAHAQHIFTDAALMPYKQDFNSLSGTVRLTGNQLTDLPAVYAQAEFGTLPNTAAYSPTTIGANDGSNTYANYYHFGTAGTTGTSTDRSLGGIAATTTADGIGYVGIRFKNGSNVVIKNLEVQYAMEQWYNSGRQDAASVSVSYLKGATVTSLVQSAGAWQTITPLGVDAPSTATVIANRDGNAAANRRVRQTTLTGINLAPGQEIMIRWGYTLNNTTNGNGLSIDDVVVTPETNVYYTRVNGNSKLDNLNTWGQNMDGSGTSPTSFTADNQTFYVLGGTATDRISTATPGTSGITGTWTVSGANSKIVVGMPATTTTNITATPGQLLLESNRNITGTIDVSDGSTFTIRNTNPSRTYKLGSLSTTSTIEYNGGTPTSLITQSYGNLVVSGNTNATAPSTKSLAGNIIVNGSVRLKNMGNLVLGDYDLTLVRRDSVSNGIKYNANIVRGGSPTSYIVAGGTGRLRISVPSNGVGILFPVGANAPTATATAYTPATLKQTAANSEDIFSVRMLNDLYASYNSTTEAGSTARTELNVKKTWLVGEEVPGGSDLSLTLQCNSADATTDFLAARARLIHYIYANSAWDQHTTSSEWGATAGTTTGSLAITRAHITSFSPFGIVSIAPTPLPVSLTAFDVRATGTAATCAWATASETNNDHFVVERSLDGATFTAIGTVKGQGTHAATTDYRFEDAAAGRLGAAAVYYRLQQVDVNGQATYSTVRTVSFGAAALALYPTPILGNEATLDLTSLAPQLYQAQVLDLTGRVLLTHAFAGGQVHPFDVQRLPAGAYMVVITGANTRQSLRLLRN